MATFRLPFNVKAALIEEVKNYPELWKGEHKKYGDRFCTAAAWKTIAQKLNISDDILKAKWKNLRNTFRSILKKTSISEFEKYDGTWKYFHLIAFLKDEFRDEEETVEFIVDSGGSDDNKYLVSHSPLTKNDNEDDENAQHNTNYVTIINIMDESQSVDDEQIMRHVNKRSSNDHTYHEKPDEDEIPSKCLKFSERKANYDVMFLRSLAPYFKQLEPLRKLVIRNRIQDLLLNEIAEQNSVKSDM